MNSAFAITCLAVLAVGALIVAWPRLRRVLIFSTAVPRPLAEFAAATLSQGGVVKMIAYHALLPWVNTRLPRPLVAWLCRKVGAQQGIDFSELERPIGDYATLDAFFTRAVRAECRPICRDEQALISPVDAEVVGSERVRAGTLLQAKGMPYRLDDLLPAPEARHFEEGSAVVLYLRPRDCHRVFCPFDAAAVRAQIFVPGGEMPVSAELRTTLPGLYVQNKRLIHLLDTPHGRAALVMIGAYKVGRMVAEYDRTPIAAPGDTTLARRDYATPVPLQRAQWLATFHLGSTVVLLFERDRFEPAHELVGRTVRYGQAIGRVVTTPSAREAS